MTGEENGGDRQAGEEVRGGAAGGGGSGQRALMSYYPGPPRPIPATNPISGAYPSVGPGGGAGSVVWVGHNGWQSYPGSFVSSPMTEEQQAAYKTLIRQQQLAARAMWDALPNEDVKVGEILAYRGWTVCSPPSLGLLLASLAHSDVWIPNVPMEGAPHGHLDGPGVYAFKTRKECDDQVGFAYVRGTVKLWGDIVEHEKGYRAQYAKIVSLDDFPPTMTHDEQVALCRLYGVAEPRAVVVEVARARNWKWPIPRAYLQLALSIICWLNVALFGREVPILAVAFAITSLLPLSIFIAACNRRLLG